MTMVGVILNVIEMVKKRNDDMQSYWKAEEALTSLKVETTETPID